jgi:hypothetical protein
MMMCLSCGGFVTATKEDGAWRPLCDECPDCDGQRFKHNGSNTVIRTADSEE